MDCPSADGNVNFDITSENAKEFALCAGLSEQEYEEMSSPKEFMDVCAKRIVDNFELKQEWHEINKQTINAPRSEFLKGPFYGQKIPIQNLSVMLDCRDNDGKEIEFDASASVPEKTDFIATKAYSFSMALRNKKTGKLHVIYNDSSHVKSLNNEFRQFDDALDDYSTELKLDSSALQITETGEFDITCVFMKDKEVVLDTLYTAQLRSFVSLKVDDVQVDGNNYSYYISSVGGRLTLMVVCSASNDQPSTLSI